FCRGADGLRAFHVTGVQTSALPISADGELDCRGFWDKGKPDKDALWTSNAELAPTLRNYVDSVGANFGRVRIIKLEPQDRDTARSGERGAGRERGDGWAGTEWRDMQ